MADAMIMLAGMLVPESRSHIYDTPECNGKGSVYANAVAAYSTTENIETVEAALKDYERECGRDDEARRRGYVPVDIDIVCLNGDVLRPRDFRQSFFAIGFARLSESARKRVISSMP